ncbi:MAG: TetR/AcrR family transcriptional regulator [Asticcacaulis sp.]
MSLSAAAPGKTASRRQAQLEALIAACERRIIAGGVKSLKARDLAADIGVALGGLYNIVHDMDALLLMVCSRTLARLGEAAEAKTAHLPMATRAQAVERLVKVAHAYLDFARENLDLWRMLFELRLDSPLPEWAEQDQLRLFRHIAMPLAVIMPELDAEGLTVRARTLFAAVHGIVTIGLEERLIAVPAQRLADEIAWLTRAACGA